MALVLADLALESEAATVTAIRLARAHDEDASGSEVAFRRLATAAAKYWVCKRGPQHAYEAMECLGGNGYTEDFPLARRYREQPVMAIWEGSGNVIALDVLRVLRREPDAVAAFDAEVSLARGANAVLDAHLDRVRDRLREVSASTDPEEAQRSARGITEAIALALQASLLSRFSPASVSDAFVAARLGPDRGQQYGCLPAGTPTAEILLRC
jgi:putative acyl-CoA dehydrogenase